ncbi:p21-activated kinase 1 [Parelaphostrongylus tenuis]|uniref:P21-activated kinase 1 n=1 Tax=Parelaphostrongylus tenuis TaxID=148309 RepID=A0AAD5MCS2_PARTN|nr:p21-activated kinase 1 [Parelaphostrongylus tenuis]
MDGSAEWQSETDSDCQAETENINEKEEGVENKGERCSKNDENVKIPIEGVQDKLCKGEKKIEMDIWDAKGSETVRNNDGKFESGAGRVAFINYNSYTKVITQRYTQLSHGEVEKRVEMKPYVLDDQICEECMFETNGGKHAPFFCPQLECLQHYCESSWTSMHSTPS